MANNKRIFPVVPQPGTVMGRPNDPEAGVVRGALAEGEGKDVDTGSGPGHGYGHDTGHRLTT